MRRLARTSSTSSGGSFGANVEEGVAEGAAIIPNLDSIAEYRVLTSNFDAEYGNYSGGLVNVVTKSGENKVHGTVFEFLRNTDLDARGFFDPSRAPFSWSYACSKALDEFLGLAYQHEKKVPTTIVRLFNTVGPRQTGRYRMVLPIFISQGTVE